MTLKNHNIVWNSNFFFIIFTFYVIWFNVILMIYKSMIVFTYVTKEICTEKQEIMGRENGN